MFYIPKSWQGVFLKSGSILWKGLCLGAIGIIAVCVSPEAKAAESIILKYGDTERTFEVDNIAAFTGSGQVVSPELESFFQNAPEARRILQDILAAEIYISPAFIAKIEQGLESPTGEFVLIQLNKLVSTPTVPDDLQPLETAVVSAFKDDNRFSMLELIRDYPESEVRVDLTGLEPVYNDVKGFVERVLPALEVAREYLQDIICDCEAPTAQGTAPAPAGTTALSTEQPIQCVDGAKPTQAQSSPLPLTQAAPAAVNPAQNAE